MRQNQFVLSDIFDRKVRGTAFGALFFLTTTIYASSAFAQGIDAEAEAALSDGYKQPPRVYEVKNDSIDASDDSVRDALKSVFKETAPDRIKDKTKPHSAVSSPSAVLKQAMVKPSLVIPTKSLESVESLDIKDVSDSSATREQTKEETKKPAAKNTTGKGTTATQAETKAVKTRKLACSGVADYYADMFHGRKTASGQIHDKTKMTAAHLSLPFGTKLKVVSRHTGKSCVVTVNDRGPYTKNKVIDLSMAAAKELGLVTAGSRMVDCYLMEPE